MLYQRTGMWTYLLFDSFVCLLFMIGTCICSKGNLELHAVPSNVVKRGYPLTLRCAFTSRLNGVTTTAATANCSFLWSHSPPSEESIQKIFTSSTHGVSISTTQGMVSTLTVQSVDESSTGSYTCHVICGQNQLGSRIRVKFTGRSNKLLQREHSTVGVYRRKTTALEKYGGLIALAALIALLLLTGLCATRVSNYRLCCCNQRSDPEDNDNGNTSANVRSRTLSDDPPAYESVLSQTAHYFSGIMGGFLGLISGLPWTRASVTPKCRRCGSRRSVTHCRRTQGRATSTQQATADNQSGLSYIHVCCERVSSPVDKPPDYWTWMKQQKSNDVFTFEIPPPLYDDVANQPSHALSSSDTDRNNTAVIIKSSSDS